MLPWPAGLQRPERGPVRDATPAEEHAARTLIGPQLATAGINILAVEVRWPLSGPSRIPGRTPYLCVYALHRRWPQELDRSAADDHARWVWIS